MNNSTQHRIRWRGHVSSPMPLAEILAKLDERRFSLWHEIEADGTWVTLETFLQENPIASNHADRPSQPRPGPLPESVAPRARDGVPPSEWESKASPPAAGPVEPANSVRPKRIGCFLALAWCGGFSGCHNLYAGYYWTGLAQALLTVLTYSVGFGLFLTWLWALLETLVVSTDARGVPMV